MVIFQNLINLKWSHFILSGELLQSGGWSHIISSCTVVSSGKANAMWSASSNIVLYCYIHQLTTCSLYVKKEDAHQKYIFLVHSCLFYWFHCWKKDKAVTILSHRIYLYSLSYWFLSLRRQFTMEICQHSNEKSTMDVRIGSP